MYVKNKKSCLILINNSYNFFFLLYNQAILKTKNEILEEYNVSTKYTSNKLDILFNKINNS